MVFLPQTLTFSFYLCRCSIIEHLAIKHDKIKNYLSPKKYKDIFSRQAAAITFP